MSYKKVTRLPQVQSLQLVLRVQTYHSSPFFSTWAPVYLLLLRVNQQVTVSVKLFGETEVWLSEVSHVEDLVLKPVQSC